VRNLKSKTFLINGLAALVYSFLLFLTLSSQSLFGYFSEYSFLTALTSIDCLNTWGNASLIFRDELYLLSRLCLIGSLALVVTTSISALVFRDISAQGIGSMRPVWRAVVGLTIALLWFCVIGEDRAASSIDNLSSIERRLFQSELGILAVILFTQFLAIHIGADFARALVKRADQGRSDNESNGRRRHNQ
jgi:hypothetical protein